MVLPHFKGLDLKLFILIRIEQTPYLIEIHCMACGANLVVKTLSSMFMVSRLKNLFQSLYGYSSSSPKGYLEFQKLAKIVKTKGLIFFFGM